VPRPFLIDTDTASDDAVALILALQTPDVDVKAVTTVAGNVPVGQATQNALYVAELCNQDVPVFPGAASPLLRQHVPADWFHGADGLGDKGYKPTKANAQPKHAVDAILETVKANPDIELITLGPLTNLALALDRYPDLVGNVKRCIIMGGAPCCEGNVTPAAEYNIWVDPEAARIVLRSGLPIELVGWHLSRGKAALDPSDIQHVLDLATPLADFAIGCNETAMQSYRRQTREIGISLPDPIAVAIAIDPSICPEASEHLVDTGSMWLVTHEIAESGVPWYIAVTNRVSTGRLTPLAGRKCSLQH
jgi:purine nucleosidase